MEFMSLYLDFVKIKLKSIIEYPGAFWAHTIAKMMGFGASLIVIYLMVYRFGNVLNWTAYEVLFLYSINTTAYALAGFFMFHAIGKLSTHIQTGTFDEMLTKPINPFFYLCCKEFSTGYIGNLLATITAMVICINKLDVRMNVINVIYLIVTIIGAALIHCALFMFTNIPVFWIVKADALTAFRRAIDDFIRYPISIYDGWIQIFLTFVIPVAFINFYPAQYFLKKNDFLGFNPILAHMTPMVGIALFVLAYAMFFLGIKNYKSTGS